MTLSNTYINTWKQATRSNFNKLKHNILAMKSKSQKQIIALADTANNKISKEINCLQCANCCRTASPIVKHSDVKRISQKLKMSEGAFVDQYLKYDEANDYVMKTLPCPFLLPDNACSIYEFRPIDCSNYPHTRGLDYSKRTNYQSENVAYCPISYHVAISIINQLNEKNQRKI